MPFNNPAAGSALRDLCGALANLDGAEMAVDTKRVETAFGVELASEDAHIVSCKRNQVLALPEWPRCCSGPCSQPHLLQAMTISQSLCCSTGFRGFGHHKRAMGQDLSV